MTTENPALSLEEAREREQDEFNTKLVSATIELRYEAQFGFLDRRGAAVDYLRSIFPTDGAEGSFDFDLGDEEVNVKRPSSMTNSFMGIGRVGLHRERMVPDTLNVFSRIARQQVLHHKEYLSGVSELSRFGFRVQQLNKIDEAKFKAVKQRYLSKFLGCETFFSDLKSQDVQVRYDTSILLFHMTETYSRGGKILEYKIRMLVGVGEGRTPNSMFKLTFSGINNDVKCFFSDLDFYIDTPLPFEDAVKLCHRVEERAVEIHRMIYDGIANG